MAKDNIFSESVSATTADFIEHLTATIPEKDSLVLVKQEADDFYHNHTSLECYQAIEPLYASDNFQMQEVAVLLCGYIGNEYPIALSFMQRIVSQHESWKVQEVLAMAFDMHCKAIGYEKALPLIRDWLANDSANVRRAVAEGLRVWTSRPYFKENPEEAIRLLAAHRNDESKIVRKSAGNALRDISKKHTELVQAELASWDLSSKGTKQTYKLARAWIEKQGGEKG